MRIRALPVSLGILVLIGALTACSSGPRAVRKPSVAIVISGGARASPIDVSEIHKLLQPEIERRGYVMAKSSRSADYFVEVRYPVDWVDVRSLTFVRAQPTVPFLKDTEWQPEASGNRDYKRAIADMVREPK